MGDALEFSHASNLRFHAREKPDVYTWVTQISEWITICESSLALASATVFPVRALSCERIERQSLSLSRHVPNSSLSLDATRVFARHSSHFSSRPQCFAEHWGNRISLSSRVNRKTYVYDKKGYCLIYSKLYKYISLERFWKLLEFLDKNFFFRELKVPEFLRESNWMSLRIVLLDYSSDHLWLIPFSPSSCKRPTYNTTPRRCVEHRSHPPIYAS